MFKKEYTAQEIYDYLNDNDYLGLLPKGYHYDICQADDDSLGVSDILSDNSWSQWHDSTVSTIAYCHADSQSSLNSLHTDDDDSICIERYTVKVAYNNEYEYHSVATWVHQITGEKWTVINGEW